MKLLFCATDAGGARNLAAIARAAGERKVPMRVLTSEHCLPLWHPCPVTPWLEQPNDAVRQLVDDEMPSVIITGTTSTPAAEQTLLEQAELRRIPTIGVVDERYGYPERFAVGGRVMWPTAITLMDRDAMEEAVADGVPAARCVVTGSPALSDLNRRATAFARVAPEVPLAGVNQPIVTFVSETIAADYGSRPGESGPLGSFLGYTERVVCASILDVLHELEIDVTLVEKLHPAATDVPDCSPRGRVRHVVLKSTDLPALLWHSTAVIGMRSMALLEAAMFGAPTISYQPGLSVPQRCTAVRIGVVPAAADRGELLAWCRSTLQSRRERSMYRTDWPFARPDAAARVLQLAERLAASTMGARE